MAGLEDEVAKLDVGAAAAGGLTDMVTFLIPLRFFVVSYIFFLVLLTRIFPILSPMRISGTALSDHRLGAF